MSVIRSPALEQAHGTSKSQAIPVPVDAIGSTGLVAHESSGGPACNTVAKLVSLAMRVESVTSQKSGAEAVLNGSCGAMRQKVPPHEAILTCYQGALRPANAAG